MSYFHFQYQAYQLQDGEKPPMYEVLRYIKFTKTPHPSLNTYNINTKNIYFELVNDYLHAHTYKDDFHLAR